MSSCHHWNGIEWNIAVMFTTVGDKQQHVITPRLTLCNDPGQTKLAAQQMDFVKVFFQNI